MHNRKSCKNTIIGSRPTYNPPKSNPIFARYKLHSKIQEPGETVQQFVTALKLLVKDCEYGQAEDDTVRDRIVFGTKSAKVREKLIDIGSDLTLERAIEVARVDKVSVQQLKEITDETEQGVHAVKKKNWRHKDSSPVQLHIHVVDVVGNMVMLPVQQWVKSAGSVTQKITSRRCVGQRRK